MRYKCSPTELSKTVFEVETSDAVLGALNEAERLVRTGDVTGLSPLIQEYFNKTMRQFGADVELSAREAAKNILEDIKNGEIKAILGESGRTISNLDRQIAGNLIGEINWKSDVRCRGPTPKVNVNHRTNTLIPKPKHNIQNLQT